MRSWVRPLLISAVLALGASFLPGTPALAITQRGHVFRFSFGTTGKDPGQFRDPTGIAVNNVTGDVYVADRKNKRVQEFEPVANGAGELVGEQPVDAFEAPSPVAVAVDDSIEGADPSRGDVYVVGASGNAIQKFSAEGVALGVIKRFELGGGKAKFEAIEGVAVDSSGSLFVYQEDGTICRFNDAASNEAELSLQAGLTGPGRPGFALDAEDNFYAGVQGEGGFPVVSKLEGITGNVLIEELDGEATSAVAVNPTEVAGNDVNERNDVYVSSGTSIAEFGPEVEGKPGVLIQRFTAPDLKEGAGIAVDSQTGEVYVTDAASGDVDVFALEPVGPPKVEGLSAQPVAPPAANARRLSAEVDPTGADTHYYFEYGASSCTATPASCIRASPTDIGGAFAETEVGVELTGLAPATYHYRVVAESSFGRTASPERTFTILALASGLLDGRAWEMVSPPNKHGASIEALTEEGGWILAAEGGDALTYVANGAIEEEVQGNRSFELQQVLATRGPGGWRSTDIATPQERAAGANFGAPEYQFFSPDLSLALVEPFVSEPSLAPAVTGHMVYLRDDQPLAPGTAERQSFGEAEANSGFFAPGFLPLVSAANAPEASLPVPVSFLAATPDLQHVVLKASAALTGPSSGVGLYEWSRGGALRFVSELPEGRPAPQVALGYYRTRAHAISDDGTRVIWTSSQESPAHLYMRDLATETTIQLDKAQGVTEPTTAGARFQTASSDGSLVFFTDDQALVQGASVEPGREVTDLYACEMVQSGGGPTCALHDLTIPLHAGEHAAVQGSVLGASEDGSSVFVVAQGVLAENENAAGETAQSGQDNLYELRHDGSEWKSTFIATLSSEDAPNWDAGPNVSDENPAFQTARVSPNGEYVAFMSQRSLTGYDNEDVSSGHPGERLDQEVYLYDSQTARLTCVSCDATGARPTGVLDQERAGEGVGLVVDRRQSWRGHWLAGSIPGWTSQSLVNALYQSRYLSNEGRLFFDSADALVPGIATPTRSEQVNGSAENVGVENVYEYEPGGVGSCVSSPSGGCVALLSSGSSQNESAFLEATPGGNDVFFLTEAQLSPQDTDDAFDVYDARVCTQESPCLTTPPPPPQGCSEAEACRAGPSPQQEPIGPAGSATFSGTGNLAPPAPAEKELKGITVINKPKPLSNAQKLAKALAACKRQHPDSKRKRQECEAHARKLYRPNKKASKK